MKRVRRISALVAAGLVLSTALAVLPGGTAPARAGEVVAMRFPVEGTVKYSNDFGAPRSGGRTHEGVDIMAPKIRKLIATVSGRVSYLKWDNEGLSGNMLTITDAAGWQYRYMHINNDTPGTDDGANPREWAFPPSLTQGSRVIAGQLVGYVGDSGNAEGTAAHLHFEIRRPDGTVLNPYESLVAAARGPIVKGRGIAANPLGGYYVLTGDGTVHAYDGAPSFGHPTFSWDIARGIAAMPDGKGYVVLDGFGGLHRYGSAATGLVGSYAGPYFGWDIARSVAISPTGEAAAVLDGFGGVHTGGNAPPPVNVYWPGWDIARSISFTPSGLGFYVLDGFGGVHAAGDAVRAENQPYWGWDVARSIIGVAGQGGGGYAVLDAWGGIHPAGGAPAAVAGAWAPNSRWNGLAHQSGRYLTVSEDGTHRRW